MSEEKPSGPPRSRRRPDAAAREPSQASRTVDEPREPEEEHSGSQDGGGGPPRVRAHAHNGGRVNATAAARRAVQAVAELTGHDVETVISIEPGDDGWKVGVEVVETHRIPDSADILATYEVRLESAGHLVSYRRTHRYSRGQLSGGSR